MHPIDTKTYGELNSAPLNTMPVNGLVYTQSGTAGPVHYRKSPLGNEFWQYRFEHGKSPAFETAADLRRGCVQYFKWATEHPLPDRALEIVNGQMVESESDQPPTIAVDDLCCFMAITPGQWSTFRANPEFLPVCSEVETLIQAKDYKAIAALVQRLAG